MSKTTEFAEACMDMNTAQELRDALADGPDDGDCQEWGLTHEEWRTAVNEALGDSQ